MQKYCVALCCEPQFKSESILGRRDAFGQSYVLDFELQGPLGKGSIRSCWIVLANERFPRMTTCYVL
jgi:Domain of unknown function (DUF6883)